jgi:hypothetical protein
MSAQQSRATRYASKRRLLPVALAASYTLSVGTEAFAEPPSAPVAVQAQVMTRILPFERGFAERARNGVTVLIVERADDADSSNAAHQMKRALADIGNVGARPITTVSHSYSSAANLAAECRTRGAQVIYLSPGLASEVPAIAAVLANSGVLTVAAVEPNVPRGAVLGIEVVAGKPHMSVNLAQARAQKLDFASAVLKLARIY